MIERVGVIVQDANSLGLLLGLRLRLGCTAELVPPPTPVGKSQYLTRRQGRIAWEHFKHKGVDLIVRLTDADRQRWQDVRRKEAEVFPNECRSIVVCGVCVNNVEDSIGRHAQFVSDQLAIPIGELRDPSGVSDRIKAGIKRKRSPGEPLHDVVAKLVADAPPSVFDTWLSEPAFRTFYDDCYAAAVRADCPIRQST